MPTEAAAGDAGPASTVYTKGITLGYGDHTVVDGLSVTVPTGAFTVIVGPNACGKSTLLRGMARLLRPSAGAAYLDGKSIHTLPSREVAVKLGVLPQSPTAPDGITVTDLVGRGRSPHQGWFGRWSDADEQAVADAMRSTDTLELADRSVDELSGGQRQRVWIAMALAQRTGVLLLDEPTTFLDVTHQVEVLDLLADLNRTEGTTIVAVLHDLNLAARYADHLVVLSEGALVAEGTPRAVVTEDLVREVFTMPCRVIDDPVSETPLVVPIGRHCVPNTLRATETGTPGNESSCDTAGSTAAPDVNDNPAAAVIAETTNTVDGPAVTTETQLREIVEGPADVISDKSAPVIDHETRRFLESSPLFLLASGSPDGTVDVSPRGDEGVGALVVDERTIAFADRPGNRRVDSMRNILRNPHVGMLFLVPGVEHTVRVNGTAAIVRAAELRDRFAVKGTPPELAVVVTVREVFIHCGRAFSRSKLWHTDTWPAPDTIPTAGTLFKAHAAVRDRHRSEP